MGNPFRKESVTATIHLGGYLWIEHSIVHLKPCATPTELIQSFTTSENFRDFTVTAPIEMAGTWYHGPFQHGAISADDFQILSASEFLAEVRRCRNVSGITSETTDDEWQEVEELLSKTMATNEWFWKLVRTEQDKDIRWQGSYHDLFREFLAAKPGCAEMERLVFGAD